MWEKKSKDVIHSDHQIPLKIQLISIVLCCQISNGTFQKCQLGINVIDHWQERKESDRQAQMISLVRAAFQSDVLQRIAHFLASVVIKAKNCSRKQQKQLVALNVAFRLLSGIILP